MPKPFKAAAPAATGANAHGGCVEVDESGGVPDITATQKPKRPITGMQIRDFNGKGDWSAAAVQARYADYAGRHSVEAPRPLAPKVYEHGDVRWVYPIMDAIIDGIPSRAISPAPPSVSNSSKRIGNFPSARISKHALRAHCAKAHCRMRFRYASGGASSTC